MRPYVGIFETHRDFVFHRRNLTCLPHVPLRGGTQIRYSTQLTRELARTGTTTLSITPLDLSRAAILLIVDRLTWSSRASPIQSGRTSFEFASIRRSSACRKSSSISNGNLGGRPLGLPVARCFFITPPPPPSTRQRIFQLPPSFPTRGTSPIVASRKHPTNSRRLCRETHVIGMREKSFTAGPPSL